MVTTVLNADGVALPFSGAPTRGVLGTKLAETLTGSIGNDSFRGGGGGDTLIGGKGDDTYTISDMHDVVVENPGEGVDTIVATVNYALPDGVENLSLTSNQTWGIGNALDNILIGGVGSQILDGKGGNDVLTGGGGADIFVMGRGYGHDVITDFQAGVDRVQLAGLGLTSFGQVQAAMTQVGADVSLDVATGERLVFRGHQVGDFSASDFMLPFSPKTATPSFDDEFNTLSLFNNGGTWWTNFGSGGNAVLNHTLLGNGENQLYVDPAYTGTGTTPLGLNPFSINNGVVSITASLAPPEALPYLATYQYVSGLLTTKTTFQQKYGYFEIRAKLPAGAGLWPAFWLSPANYNFTNEINIFEGLGKDTSTIYQATHYKVGTTPVSTVTPVHLDNPDQFHTFSLLWDQNYLIWYVDGVETSRLATPADMNQASYIILNLAEGGYWPGKPDPSALPGAFQIDYVRAYALSSLAPATAADAYVLTQDTVLSATAGGGVLANDSDPIGNALTATLAAGPAHGALTLGADGSFTYTPTPGYSGSDSFTYLASDGTLQTAPVTVSLTVAHVNHVPIVNADAVAMSAGGTLTIPVANLLANDTDSDGDPLSVIGVAQGSNPHGTVQLANGVVTYTPSPGFSGSDTFTYAVTDGHIPSPVTGTVRVTVAPLPAVTTNGGAGADIFDFSGRLAPQTINGLGGDDTLIGGLTGDKINGGAGNDLIVGGPGADILVGGTGNDRFQWSPGDVIASAPGTQDAIYDFEGAGDGAASGDVLALMGFSAGSSLALKGQSSASANLFYYTLTDAASGASQLIAVSSLDGHALVAGDYLFL